MSNKYNFIIDINKYAGNFERKMCAYVCGQWGDCRVGVDIGEKFEIEFPDLYKIFSKLISSESDDSGCWRPVKIYPTPGLYNSGMGKSYPIDTDLDIVRKELVEDTIAYYSPLIERAKENIAIGNLNWQNGLNGYCKRIEEAKTKEIAKHNSYNSVSITFNDSDIELLKSLIQFMKDRAKRYAKENNIEIIGFRFSSAKISKLIESI